MLKLVRLLIRLRPVIKEILPVLTVLLPEIIEFLRDNKALAERNIARPETGSRQDVKDTFRDGDFSRYWE